MKAYIVGPLFTEAEERQRLLEGQSLRTLFEKLGIELELSNPVEFNFDGDTSSSDIFRMDYERLKAADFIIFDLSNEDSGSCVALGMTINQLMNGRDVKIYPVIHDCRLSRNSKSGLESTCGFNSMVVGCLKANNINIYNGFKEVLKAILKDMKEGKYNV